uniref:monocarboxylate transporter 2-like n=1 Tax=Ciona intestinalis TaxID=7719 RepID=UPI0000524AA1|nr:monocarboxylate transporter 2-like [Ciona intestinalis]|eukprot:XP_002130128.1 monocarboxylate transporter 2-like [Ciona intestinalis]
MRKDQQESLDGGWGWVVAFSGVIVYSLVFGTARCQSTVLVPIMNTFETDYSSVGWVSAIVSAGLAIGGNCAAQLMPRIGHRNTMIVGGLVAGVSCVIASFSVSMLMLDVFAGLILGFGSGLAYVPTPVIIGYYFKKRRSLATHIASMGSPLGSFIICPMNKWLVNQYGIHGYYLIMGGVYFNLCIVGALMRPIELSLRLAKRRPQIESEDDSKAHETESVDLNINHSSDVEVKATIKKTESSFKQLIKNKPFLVLVLSQIILMTGYSTFQLYIAPYAELQVNIDPIKASILFSITAAVDIPSRIIFGLIGDLKGVNCIITYGFDLMGIAMCSFLFTFTTSFTGLAIVAALLGVFLGGLSGLFYVILADIVGLANYGTAIGIVIILNGVGTLLSPPLVGLAVNSTNKPSTALYISGGFIFVSSLLTLLVQVVISWQKRNSKQNIRE